MLNILINTAHANETSAQGGGGIQTLILLGVMLVVFYFLVLRPQSKRAKQHKQLIAALQKGDEVISNSGIVGKITEVGDQFVHLQVADKVVIRVQKDTIASVLPKGTLKAV